MLCIHHLSRKIIIQAPSFSQIYYGFTIFLANSIWIYYLVFEFTICSRINHKFTSCLENSVWINYLFRAVTMNSYGLSRIYYEAIVFFANSLWMYYVFRELTIISLSDSRIYYPFLEFTKNSLSVSVIHYRFDIFFENTMRALSFSRLFKNLNKIKKIALEFEHMYIIYSVLYTIWPNSPIWRFLDQFDLWWLFMTWFDLK